MNPPSFDVPSPASMNALLPAFSFESLLNSHSHGAVFAAKQISLDRHVAIKLLSPQASSNPEFRNTFQDNAKAMASLNHPNLISVFDSGLANGMLYSVSEFVPGKSLSHSMASKPIEWSLSLRLTNDIAIGLAHAHRNDIVHGCLSPDDILLTPKIEPKIGNFGLSGPGKLSNSTLPTTVAPEVAAGSTPDPRSDVFSLGAIFYQLLTGLPHGPDQPTPSSVIACPPAADDFWKKATHAKAGQRFQSIAELQTALTALIAAGKPTPKSAVAAEKSTSNAESAKRVAIPASPAVGAAANPPIPPPPVKVGFNWTLLRNLVIIAGLLYAISLAWDHYNANKLKTAERQREADAKYNAAKQKALDDAKARANERNAANQTGEHSLNNQEENTSTSNPTIVETPEESLARLKSALITGKRSEYPKGSVSRGNNHYFLVKAPMDWPSAATFAEEHGAHLAIPSAEANLQWISEQFFTEPGIWLGAARSGQSAWTLADATRWKPAKDPLGTGHFLAVDKAGLLRAASSKSRLPFVLQWHNDGTNPGSLANWLKISNSTRTSPDPIFPPGTRHYQNRHFLRVSRECSWDEALALSELSGGHLAAPSSVSEAAALEDLTRDLDPTEVLWLGGKSSGTTWSWVSGELWKFNRWAAEATSDVPDSALVLRPGSGWDSRKPSRSAKGFIIEWSSDRNSTPAPPANATSSESNTAASLDLTTLKAKAKELLSAANQKRTKELENNAKKLTWSLDAEFRNLPKSDQNTWEIHVIRLKNTIRDFRVPTAIPLSSGIRLNAQMAKFAEYASTKQAEIDEAFIADATKLQQAYLTKLAEAKNQAVAAAKRNLADDLTTEINNANNLKDWCNSLGIEARPANPVAGTSNSNRSSNSRLLE